VVVDGARAGEEVLRNLPIGCAVGSPFRDARRLRRKAVQGAVLAVTRSYAEDLSATVGGHAGGDEQGSGHDATVDPGLHVGGVGERVRELDMVEGPVAEASRFRSSSVQMRDASLRLMPEATPRAATRSSTLRWG
jgi:hypothetical protein